LFEDGGNIEPKDSSLENGEFYLKGVYEARYEGGVRLETYSFFAEKKLVFKPSTDALIFQQIDLDRVGYVTRRTIPKAIPGEMKVESSLVIDGAVTFKPMQGFDLTDIESVKFSELAIDLKFDLPLAGLEFSFTPSNLTFNFGSPKSKGGRGIFRSLPLKFRSFSFWGNGIKLPDLGFFKLGPSSGTNALKYGLGFELDLGSLGKLTEKIKAFKLNLVLGFAGGGKNGGAWDVGFKIDGGGGQGLEFGLESVLKLKAERFELKQVPSTGTNKQYALAALGARLYVFDRAFPDDKGSGDRANLNLFLFADPKMLKSEADLPSSLGWFVARVGDMDYDSVRLDAIALGQKVDTFGTAHTTREILDYVQDRLGASEAKAPFDKIMDLIDAGAIRYAPDRDWAIAFRSLFFKQIFIDFVMNDPALYGIRVDVKLLPNPKDSNANSFISLDVLYRRLTEELGVYSVEFVPPPTWRQIDFGAVAVTIPAIGLEIYTDGGFTVDLGFPRNHDFSRAFAVNVGPFLGSGGFYFGRVSGPGAKLVPHPKFKSGTVNPKKLRYDPVTQIGLGARVGLGREILKGPLRAGLSITIFGYLEGAYGVLYASNPTDIANTTAARTYTVLAGSVGIMGEVYGYVDFGIVKAGVSIRLWIAYGLTIATHRSTRVYVEAGVEVYVEIVIARFRVFGRTFEIRISFSFSTTLDFSVYLGSDGPPDAYDFGRMIASDILAPEWQTFDARGLGTATADRSAKIDWSKIPTLDQWRVGGVAQKLPLSLVFSPDVTIVPGAAKPLPEAVLMLMLASRAAGATGPVSPFEELMRGLAAWLLMGALAGSAAFDPKNFLVWPISFHDLDVIADRLNSPSETNSAGLRDRVPSYDELIKFLQQGTTTTIGLGNKTDAAHISFPMPPEIRLVRKGFGPGEYNNIDLTGLGLVTDDYRLKIDRHFEELVLLLRQRDDSHPFGPAAASGRPLARALFEENFGLLLRSAAEKLRRILLDREAANKTATVAELLDDLVAPPSAVYASPAAEAGAFTSRFFLHGLALPYPEHAGATPNIPPLLRAAKSPQALYRLAWLQLPLADRQAGATWTVGIEQGTWTWGQVTAGTEGELQPGAIKQLEDAIHELSTKPELLPRITVRPGKYGEFIPREIAAGRAARLVDKTSPSRDRQLLLMPPEIRRLVAKQKAEDPVNVALHGHNATGKQETDVLHDEILSGTFAIAIEIAIRRIPSPGTKGFVADIVEIGGARETDRLLLDLFENPELPDQVVNVDLIASLSLFKPTDASYEELMPAAKGRVVLVQANLSTEARPDDANLFARSMEKLVESRQAFQPVRPFATLNDWGSFVELIRRASIVKTGGYYLGYAGAEADLADLFAEQTRDDVVGPQAQPRLLLLVELKATGQYTNLAKAANAMVFGPNAFSSGKVYGFQTVQKNFAGVHEPGVVPLLVTRPAPNALYSTIIDGKEYKGFDEIRAALRKKYPNDEERVTRELAALGSARIELLQRFTMLDYRLVDVDSGDKPIIEADAVLPFQPTIDNELPRQPDKLQYRLSLPVSQAVERARKAGGNSGSPTNPYKLVGRKFRAEFGWRDIYGNPWPIGPRDRHEFKICHSDRLIPISDLAHFLYRVRPGGKSRTITIRMELDRETIDKLDHVSDPAAPPPPGVWLLERATLLRRAKPTYLRAADQYEGHGVTGAVTTSLSAAKDDAGLSITAKLGEIATLLRNIAGSLEALATLFDDARAQGWPRKKIKDEITKLAKFAFERELTFAGVPTTDFIEIGTKIVIQRDKNNLPEGWGTSTGVVPIDDCGDVLLAEVPLAFAPSDAIGGAGGNDFLKDLAAKLKIVMPTHALATGYGSVPGITEHALWLVREAVLPVADQKTSKSPNVLALTPLATTLRSFLLESLPVFDPTNLQKTERRELRDVDVDVLARTALARIEQILAPNVGPALAIRTPPVGLPLEKIGASLEQIANSKAALAKVLAKRLEPVFRDAMPPANLDGAQRLLSDRLRRRLTDAYAIDAVLVYPDIKKPDGSLGKYAPQAFGKIAPVVVGTSELSIEPGNLDLASTAATLIATCDARGTAQKSSSGGQSLLPWFNLPSDYEIAHVQRSRPGGQRNGGKDGPDVSRYRSEAWLRLVEPRKLKLPPGSNVEPVVPIVLRTVPVKPVFAGQQWSVDNLPANGSQNAVIGSARSWNYEADWIWAPESQDRLRAATEYNSWPASDASSGALFASVPLEWPERFARFEASTGAAFDKIVAESTLASLSADAVEALAYFAARCVDLVRNQTAMAAFAAGPEILTDRIVFREREVGSKRELKWSYIDKNGGVIELPKGTPQRTPRSFAVRAVSLDDTNPKLGTLVAIATREGLGTIDPGEVDEATRVLRRRRLQIKALDILDMQAAWFSVSLTRNEEVDIGPKLPLRESFVYRLAEVRAGEPVTPLIRRAEPVHVARTLAKLDKHLADFMTDVLASTIPGGTATGVMDLFAWYDNQRYEALLNDVFDPKRRRSGAFIDSFPSVGIGEAATIATRISTWINGLRVPPSRAGNGRYIGAILLDARVYSSLTQNRKGQPILWLQNCLMPCQNINDI